MYTNVRYTIKVNELFTGYFKVDQGVKQGCPLSPTLFNIIINDLVLDLRKAGVGLNLETDNVCSLLYADDVALCAESEKDLQTLLDVLHSWYNQRILEINPNKTKIIHFRPINHKLSKYTFFIGNHKIPYNGKFWIGVNFRIFRMMARHTKINTTKSFTCTYVCKNVKVKIRIRKSILKALRPFIRKFAPSKISRYTIFKMHIYFIA